MEITKYAKLKPTGSNLACGLFVKYENNECVAPWQAIYIFTISIPFIDKYSSPVDIHLSLLFS
jgi:hypothetical protein